MHLKQFIQNISTMVKHMFDSTSQTTLKECYQALLLFTLTNFIVLIFWAINPFEWNGLTSVIFDSVIIIYGLTMMFMMTSTLTRRFNDASINPFQALIYPIVMSLLFVLIRIRSFSQIIIIIILSLYFLSHFYLMMLVMMPSIKHDDQTS